MRRGGVEKLAKLLFSRLAPGLPELIITEQPAHVIIIQDEFPEVQVHADPRLRASTLHILTSS